MIGLGEVSCMVLVRGRGGEKDGGGLQCMESACHYFHEDACGYGRGPQLGLLGGKLLFLGGGGCCEYIGWCWGT